jgi:hypothetical protein
VVCHSYNPYFFLFPPAAGSSKTGQQEFYLKLLALLDGYARHALEKTAAS